MNALQALLCAFALVPCTALANTATAKPVEEEVRAMIGRVHAPAYLFETLIFGDLSCVDYGSGMLVFDGRPYRDWGTTLARCQGRYVMMLEKRVREGKTVDDSRWRVVDAHLLPEVVGIKFEPDKPEGPYLFTPEACQLRGDTKGNAFYSVVRLSKRKRMDWRTGVLGAWGYDMKQQRIVPLDIKRVVCHKPQPE